ncbi:hypothetical protein, partial [Methanosphaera stadtmanae]|uniref:hypothetical protein n=1 Tax=Methanosphaera stadtmanae TaxID=2317 RepID=UPI002E77C10B
VLNTTSYPVKLSKYPSPNCNFTPFFLKSTAISPSASSLLISNPVTFAPNFTKKLIIFHNNKIFKKK